MPSPVQGRQQVTGSSVQSRAGQYSTLPRTFYARSVHDVARDLLGMILVRMLLDRRGRIARIGSGPGRLTRALRIDRSLNRGDLCAPGPLSIGAASPVSDPEILRGPRIGVEYAGAWARKPWRLGVRGSAALSRPFQATRL